MLSTANFNFTFVKNMDKNFNEMNKTTIVVPKGIRFLSDWKGYNLDNFNGHYILNKKITGCGFTEYCIRCDQNVIILSPRKLLLQNKKDQHSDIYYFKNDLESGVNFEKVISKDENDCTLRGFGPLVPEFSILKKKLEEEERKRQEENLRRVAELKKEVQDYWWECKGSPVRPGKPCKILVTYDSFRHVKEALGDDIKYFKIIVDEFQSIMIDSRFKSTTEMELLYQLNDIDYVCFVSATPLLDKYLAMLNEFKDLPYYELDWEKEDPDRVVKPIVNVKVVSDDRSVESEANKVIEKYLEGKFEAFRTTDKDGKLIEIVSNEAVLYVNSVNSIAKIIKKNGLTYDNTNVLCAKTKENEKKIQKAFGITKRELKKNYGVESCLGNIPGRGETHKMFTFCTRTVYLGADFYSKCARSFIYSDANIKCLNVDISMDLEQILGRQRLDINPWKNMANLYVKTNFTEISINTFTDLLTKKESTTKRLLNVYQNTADSDSKSDLANLFDKSARAFNYIDNYVAVNKHGGKDLIPTFNNLVLISELRAFELQQIDYRDRFSVFSSIQGEDILTTGGDSAINVDLQVFNSKTNFIDKMRYLCEEVTVNLKDEELNRFLECIPLVYKNAYLILGPARLKALSYKKSRIEEEYRTIMNNQASDNILDTKIFENFTIGNKYTKEFLKSKLSEIYKEVGYKKTAKANDIEKWFEVKTLLITNKETGKRDSCFYLMKIK